MMEKPIKENKIKQISEEESIEYIKEVYDGIMKTYEVLFEHMSKVDQLIKEKNAKSK